MLNISVLFSELFASKVVRMFPQTDVIYYLCVSLKAGRESEREILLFFVALED